MNCPKCGTENNKGNTICEKCGFDLTKRPTTKKLFVWSLTVIALIVITFLFLHSNSAINLPLDNKDKSNDVENAAILAYSGQLQLAGSTTVPPLAEELAEAFMDLHPDVSIDVLGGGSSVGVTAAGEGSVDFGVISRDIDPAELESFPNLQVHTIAYDGVAIVVHPDISLPSLSIEEARGIFSGEITNFSQVGGSEGDIIVVSREDGSGTRAVFEALVMENEKEIINTAILQQSNGQVRTIVAETPNAIGYLSFGFLDDSIKSVSIDEIAPSITNIKNESYAIFRPLNLVSNGAPGELAQAFLDFIFSDDGQAIVSENYMTVID